MIGILKLNGHDNIAAAQRHHSRDAHPHHHDPGHQPPVTETTLRDYAGTLT